MRTEPPPSGPCLFFSFITFDDASHSRALFESSPLRARGTLALQQPFLLFPFVRVGPRDFREALSVPFCIVHLP